MSQFIPFRLTDNNQYTQEELITFFNKHTNIKAVFEVSQEGQPHYHGYIKSDISKQSLIGWLKTELHCKGNRDYSMTTKELKNANGEEGYYRYMSKGSKISQPKLYYNLESDWVQKYYKNYWDVNKELVEIKKVNKDSIKTKLMEYIQEHSPYEYDQLIVERILMYYKEKDTPVSYGTVENYFHYAKTILYKDYVHIRANNIYNKIIKFEN